jgi:hypothetical protein
VANDTHGGGSENAARAGSNDGGGTEEGRKVEDDVDIDVNITVDITAAVNTSEGRRGEDGDVVVVEATGLEGSNEDDDDISLLAPSEEADDGDGN